MKNNFVNQPLLEKLNRENPITRLERLERAQAARPSQFVNDLGELSVSPLTVDILAPYFTRTTERMGMGWQVVSGAVNAAAISSIGCTPTLTGGAAGVSALLTIGPYTTNSIVMKTFTSGAAQAVQWPDANNNVYARSISKYYCITLKGDTLADTSNYFWGFTSGAIGTPETGTYILVKLDTTRTNLIFEQNVANTTSTNFAFANYASGSINPYIEVIIAIDDVAATMSATARIGNANGFYAEDSVTLRVPTILVPASWSVTPMRAICGIVPTAGNRTIGLMRGYIELN